MVANEEILHSGIFDFPVFPLWENALREGSGGNGRQVLLCLTDKKEPATGAFLEKVMAAVGIDLSGDAFSVHVPAGYQINFSSLDHEMGFETALFFGLRPGEAGLQLQVQKYQPVSFLGKTFLFSDSLERIQQQPELKRPLWEGLKAVFK